ncbi:MAG: hypothetical protein IPH31_20765 [Lewinellaceae bacterium]|nr:hypothetical protein [Lewinellaceae bacterium]
MTNRQNVFSISFSLGLRQWRIAAIIYFIQLCLAMTLGMQAHSVLESSIGNSLEINKLLAQYDHTVLTDFLKVHGASITPLIGQLRWLLLVWLIFSVFINAGMLYCAGTEQTKARAFLQGGAEYFFAFLKISFIFLILILVWTMAIWLPMLLFMEPSLQYFSSEKYTVWLALSLMVIYLVGLALLFIWSVISRFVKIKTDASTASCIKKGWAIFRKNKAGFLILMFGFAAVQIALLGFYWLLEALTGMTSPGLILVLFVVQQAFVFFRIQLRQILYSGVCYLATPNEAPRHVS